MAKVIQTGVQIRDTNTDTYSTTNVRSANALIHVVNGLDQNADVNVYGSYESDTGFSDRVQIDTTTTVNAGTANKIDMKEPWDRIQIEVSCSTAPTSGSIDFRLME